MQVCFLGPIQTQKRCSHFSKFPWVAAQLFLMNGGPGQDASFGMHLKSCLITPVAKTQFYSFQPCRPYAGQLFSALEQFMKLQQLGQHLCFEGQTEKKADPQIQSTEGGKKSYFAFLCSRQGLTGYVKGLNCCLPWANTRVQSQLQPVQELNKCSAVSGPLAQFS